MRADSHWVPFACQMLSISPLTLSQRQFRSLLELGKPSFKEAMLRKHLLVAASFLPLGVQGCGVCAGMGVGPGGFLHPLRLYLLTTPPAAVSVQPRGPVVLQQRALSPGQCPQQ